MIFPVECPVKLLALQGSFLGQIKDCFKMSFPPFFEVFHRLFPRNKPKTMVKQKFSTVYGKLLSTYFGKYFIISVKPMGCKVARISLPFKLCVIALDICYAIRYALRLDMFPCGTKNNF